MKSEEDPAFASAASFIEFGRFAILRSADEDGGRIALSSSASFGDGTELLCS